jgi:uncharacterized integral membrane protein
MSRKDLKILSIVLLTVTALVLAFQNRTSVTTRLLFVDIDMPVALLMLLNLAVGFVIGLLVAARIRRQAPAPPAPAPPRHES